MIGRAAQGKPWLPGQIARYFKTGRREPPPPLEQQIELTILLYEEMLSHHGSALGLRHARKHLGWALDYAAATGAVAAEVLKLHRGRVLTAQHPKETVRRLGEAYDAFAWRCAA
jgi:tRNA-dihydrouridine synthase